MIQRYYVMFLSILIFVAVSLGISNYIFVKEYQEIEAESRVVNQGVYQFESEIKKINSRISMLDTIQSDFVPWTYVFKAISNISSNGISYTSIVINKENKEVRLKGFSNERSELLKLKSGLESSVVFTDINFPIQNILEKENIRFDITAILNMEKIGYEI